TPAQPRPQQTTAQLAQEWPGLQPSGSPPSGRTVKVAIGAIAVLAVAGFLGYEFLSTRSESAGSESSSDAAADSTGPDVDQIKQLAATWDTDLNNPDLAGLQSLMCSGSAAQLPRDIFATRDGAGGTLSSELSNIKVTGNQATATVTSNWSLGSRSRFDNTYA